MDIGSRISKRLFEIGMTQAALAKRLKTSETTVSHWMTGKFRPASRYLKKLAEELRTSTSYLNGETDNPDAIEMMQLGSELQPGVEQPKDRVVDYSLKMGAWGVSVERRMAGGMEIKLEAPSGTEKKIKTLMDAVWEIIGGGYVTGGAGSKGEAAPKGAAGVSQSEALARKRTEAHLLVESLNEEQLGRLNKSFNRGLPPAR